MLRASVLFAVCLFIAANVHAAERGLTFTGDFESGELRRNGSNPDGFFLKTLPNPQGSVRQSTVGRGGAGPNSNLDARVVSSEKVGSETVKPRSGKYFMRSAIYFDKKYDGFTGNSSKNKPRMTLIAQGGDREFDYDVEGYTSFSIYLPENLEDETGRTGEQGKNMLMNLAGPGAAELFTLNYWVPRSEEGGGNDSHWWIRLSHSTRSTNKDKIENIDLGSVAADKGKWTDFVIRWRANPFSVRTNPAKAGIRNAKDQYYEGNKGILQVWKSEGSGRMVLKVNKVNTPVGLVPHKSWTLGHSFRQYKHGWHQQPTSVKGPIWVGFDEIRFGLAGRDNTSFSDVHPTQLVCSGCGNDSVVSSSSAPEAPKSLVIGQ